MADIAQLLDEALSTYAHIPEVGVLVRSSVGVVGPKLAGEAVIEAFHLVPGDEVFAAYVFTPGCLFIAEMNDDGASLVVAVPVARVRRIAEMNNDRGLTVTLEIDADVVRHVGEWEQRNGAISDGDFDRGGAGRFVATQSASAYQLTAEHPDIVEERFTAAGTTDFAEDIPQAALNYDALRRFCIDARRSLHAR